MDDNKKAKLAAETEKDEALLTCCEVRIVDQASVLVGEHRLRIVECHAVLAGIRSGFDRIPLKP